MTGRSDWHIYGNAACHTLSYQDMEWIRNKANQWFKDTLVPYCSSIGKNVMYDPEARSWDTYVNYYPSKEAGLECVKGHLAYMWQECEEHNGSAGLCVTLESTKEQNDCWGWELFQNASHKEYYLFLNWS